MLGRSACAAAPDTGSTLRTSAACFRNTQHPRSCTDVGRGRTGCPWARGWAACWRWVVRRSGWRPICTAGKSFCPAWPAACHRTPRSSAWRWRCSLWTRPTMVSESDTPAVYQQSIATQWWESWQFTWETERTKKWQTVSDRQIINQMPTSFPLKNINKYKWITFKSYHSQTFANSNFLLKNKLK